VQRIETLRSTIYPCHCDTMGHLTTSQYTLLFDAATWSLLRHAGVDDEFGQSRTHGWADVEVTVRYQKEVRVGAAVKILSGFRRAGTRSLVISHEMRSADSDQRHALYEATSVRFDLTERIAIAIPPEVHAFLLDPTET